MLLDFNKKSSSGKTKDVTGEKKKKPKFAKTAQETLPYLNVYRSGIIETNTGYYTKAYKLEDMNFRVAPQEVQDKSFEKYEELLNSFDANSRLQIVINNRNIDEKSILDDILCPLRQDTLDDYRKEMNNILVNKLEEGRNNLISEKYLCVGISARDIKEATTAFSTRIDTDISQRIRTITGRQNVPVNPMTIEERLKCIHDICNIGNESNLPENFNLDDYIKQGMTTKDLVAPSYFKFKEDHFKIGEKYGQIMYLRALPSSLSTDFTAEIADLPFNLTASIFLEPIDQTKGISMVRNQMVAINGNVIDAEKRASASGYSVNLISPDLRHSQEQAQYLIDDMRSSNQRIFFLTFTIAHYADSLEELKENASQIKSMANRYMCAMDVLYYQQEYGFDAVLPLCNNQVSIKRMMKTESAALFIPFNTQELMQKHGMYYGLNGLSKNLLMFNRTAKENKNPNGLILGLPGSGKSMTAKIEIVGVLLTKDDNNEVYVLDPEAEYSPMAKAFKSLGGEVIHIEPGSGIYINPFDMDLNYGQSDEGNSDPVTLKSDYIGMLCETAMSGKSGLTNIDRSIIDRCVRNLYKPYLAHMQTLDKSITMDINASPTMDDFYEMLMSQPEPEARNIALALEIYCRGSFDSFAHKTNVDVNKRFVVYDIKDIGNGMKELGLQVCLNHVWNKTISNKSKGIRTWIYIDEFHILTQSETSSNFLMQIWKRARKWNGVPTAITQNVEDLLKTEASRAIITNCEFVIMLSQSYIDRINLKEFFKISDAQLEYITNSPAGQGLIYNGTSIVPFVNNFPSNTKIYEMITTRPDDQKMPA